MLESGTFITLVKDCDALLIPTAVPISIPSGTNVQVTQARGGSVTVVAGGNLARIDSDNLDALGISAEDIKDPILPARHAKNKIASGPVDVDAVWAILRTCFDPEIPVNIVDLGLIYECISTAKENGKKNLIEIKMTLTAPACAMGPVIVEDIEKKVLTLDNATDIAVELVFDPPWSREMMSDAAKLELGLL